ncbi:hypothetical protein K2173_019623 [Erythroxylum novogranatense]|uniref:SHSP domain-containing protein n=1 Tax=Erythroxylum novogranatense TaxID=1862640 RepID=A0AAV8UD16_9ROSI|nr:hypothetical protein K2173_019623 [Erythroxylum novogranatense]
MSIFSRKERTRHEPSSFHIWDPHHDRRIEETIFEPDHPQSVEAEIEWKETPQALLIKAFLPGFEREDMEIAVERGNILRISGEKSVEKEENGSRWFRAERARARFSQPFKLPETAIIDRLDARMENGLLTVTVPKRERFDSRRIIKIS